MKSLIVFGCALSLTTLVAGSAAKAQSQYDGHADFPNRPFMLEDHVLRAERAFKEVAYGDYPSQSRAGISKALDQLHKAAHDCDRKLVTAKAKHDHAAELGKECKKGWDGAVNALGGAVTTANKEWHAMPPEVNSARMYTGPGAAPMLEAAAAWEGLTAELEAAAVLFNAAAPYAGWLSAEAGRAATAAAQAKAAAEAFEAALNAASKPAAH